MIFLSFDILISSYLKSSSHHIFKGSLLHNKIIYNSPLKGNKNHILDCKWYSARIITAAKKYVLAQTHLHDRITFQRGKKEEKNKRIIYAACLWSCTSVVYYRENCIKSPHKRSVSGGEDNEAGLWI